MVELNVENINLIAEKIKSTFYHYASHRLSLFLCGASVSDPQSVRSKFAEYIEYHGRYFTDLIYPEDIFDELLYGSSRNNLLSLEVLLADSVDSVVMILESEGALAEFGAFTHDEKLREKLVCIIDEKYKKDKSFINQGPVRLIKQVNKSHVLYADFSSQLSLNHCFHSVLRAANTIRRSKVLKSNKISLLKLELFLLPAIYLLEPINIDFIKKMVKVVTEDDKNSALATTASLSIMSKKKYVYRNVTGEYLLTKNGLKFYQELIKPYGRVKNPIERKALDALRLDIFN